MGMVAKKKKRIMIDREKQGQQTTSKVSDPKRAPATNGKTRKTKKPGKFWEDKITTLKGGRGGEIQLRCRWAKENGLGGPNKEDSGGTGQESGGVQGGKEGKHKGGKHGENKIANL